MYCSKFPSGRLSFQVLRRNRHAFQRFGNQCSYRVVPEACHVVIDHKTLMVLRVGVRHHYVDNSFIPSRRESCGVGGRVCVGAVFELLAVP